MKSATALLQSLAAGEITARNITTQALATIAEQDGKIRAFITVATDAMEQAEASHVRRAAGQVGALEGLPVAIKDNIDVRGLPTSLGTAHFAQHVATKDAAVVAALRAAGAIILGKLNMHEGALGATTDNPFFGRCENPLAPGYTPGGSSGGSAAAIAAGFVPLTLGTDTMGSVRIPAAYCGLFGLKPTRGSINTDGLHFLSQTLDTIGPMAANAEDLALISDLLLSPTDSNESLRGIATCTLALPIFQSTQLEPAVEAAIDRFITRLRSQKISLNAVGVEGWDPGRLRRAGLLVCEVEGSRNLQQGLESATGGFSNSFRAMLDFGSAAAPERVAAAYGYLGQVSVACITSLQGTDALLLPTAPQRAFRHGDPIPADQADFTALANVAGLPSVAFPLPAPDGGLPCSAQLIGRPHSDRQLITLAGRLHEIAHDY